MNFRVHTKINLLNKIYYVLTKFDNHFSSHVAFVPCCILAMTVHLCLCCFLGLKKFNFHNRLSLNVML